MRKTIVALCLLPVLAACHGGNPNVDRSPEWQALKASCVDANFDACADIGHQARDATREPRVFKISDPIVD